MISTDVKQFYNYVKDKRTVASDSPVFYENNIYVPNEQVPNTFAKYFKSIYSNSPADYFIENFVSHNNFYTLNISCISESDYSQSVKKLKPKRAAGFDGIPPYVVKGCSDFFKIPLLYIFNLCIKTKTFPCLWKTSIVSPIFKSGERSNVSNYRPISVLSAPDKLFEQIIYNYLWLHLSTFIPNCQHGFIPRKSTLTNLFSFNNFIYQSFEHRVQVDVIFTDFQKAFDRVDHDVLLKKLCHYGISMDVLKVLSSYLRNRRFIVKYNCLYSDEFDAYSGVPQGSNLGPLLFLYFINDLPEVISHSNCLLFADDLKFFRQIKSFNDCKLLQDDINAVCIWSDENKLAFNIKKCSAMSFTRNSNTIVASYFMYNSELDRVTAVKDLGITIDSKLTYQQHIGNMVKSAYKSLGFLIREAKQLRNLKSIIMLYNALVRPRLEYCSLLWHALPKKYTESCEKVQKKFLRFLYFKKYNRPPDYNVVRSAHLRQEFEINSLFNRRIIIILLFAYKILNNLANDSHILSLFEFNIPQKNTRCRQLLFVRTVKTNYYSPLLVLNRLVNFASSKYNVDFFQPSLIKFQGVVRNIFNCNYVP